ncbi:MAG: cytidylate kinase [Flavobacteriaceae bacterium]|nr:cytidylate kinase [Flavobacteriaceae bacterium]|tara:strand:+ start:973 stop:1668 length:696 start_codon:yes stop_codon:yes gene_type:complete
MVNQFIITIDGTSSTGKSTIAKRIAKKIGYVYIDSGAMYRALTYYSIQKNIISKSFFKKDLLINALPSIKINFIKNPISKNLEVNLNGNFIEDKIRSLLVSDFVSELAKLEDVRSYMVKIQHSLGNKKGIVMDGRDIGTVVFPNAEYKFYLDASSKLRAKRRYDELIKENKEITFNEVFENICSRDEIDINRSNSPLKKASDAILIDTENLNLDQVENKILKYLNFSNLNT